MKAQCFTELNGETVRCDLCPHRCVMEKDGYGRCGVRKNQGGVLVAESYGKVSSLALDPIEKKPLRRFLPGRMILSVGSYGCNMGCPFCQNHSISMEKPVVATLSPEALAARSAALEGRDNVGVAFTYNEPLIGYEYVLDCAQALAERGQRVVLVTNGCIRREPLEALLPYVDAMNIDLKAFREDSYRALGGSLEAVQESIRLAARHCHVEVTTLVVPGINDSEAEMEELSRWLASVDKDIPLHVTRFFPRYRMQDRPPTPVATVHRLVEVARRHLADVEAGNC